MSKIKFILMNSNNEFDSETCDFAICACSPGGDGEFTICGRSMTDCGYYRDDSEDLEWCVYEETPPGKIDCEECIKTIKAIKKIKL